MPFATVLPTSRVTTPERTAWTQVAVYYAIACLSSWLIWTPVALGQDGLKLLDIRPSAPVLICVGTLGPTLACYVTHRLWAGNWRAVRILPPYGRNWLWLVIGPMLVLLGFFLILPLMASDGPPEVWSRRVNVLGGIPRVMFGYGLLGGPLFEEFGWRGFLQARLQRLLTPWIAAVCVGILWAAWHLPLFLVDGWNSGSVLAFFVTCIGLAAVFAFAFNASGQSVAVAILMHSAFNASPRFLGTYLDKCPMREDLSGESWIAASFLLPAAVLVLATRGNLAVKRTE